MNELWKPVPGFEKFYEASTFGRIRSIERTMIRKDGKPLKIKGGILSIKPNSRGYPRVSLCINGTPHWRSVHSVVAETFLQKPPKTGGGKEDYGVNHKDGNKTNNHISNLEYITNKENVIHARENNLLCVVGEKNGRAKVTDNDIQKIRNLYKEGMKQTEIAKIFGIHQTNISRIIRGTSWKHLK
jgi:hypothetical protein